jgi:hypothetical protein
MGEKQDFFDVLLPYGIRIVTVSAKRITNVVKLELWYSKQRRCTPEKVFFIFPEDDR